MVALSINVLVVVIIIIGNTTNQGIRRGNAEPDLSSFSVRDAAEERNGIITEDLLNATNQVVVLVPRRQNFDSHSNGGALRVAVAFMSVYLNSLCTLSNNDDSTVLWRHGAPSASRLRR